MTVLKRKTADLAKQVKASAEAPAQDLFKEEEGIYIPTGSTMLNLACSDHPFGGFSSGKIVNVVGDSSAGKSFLMLTMLATLAHLPEFDDHRLIYDDAEHASEFNMEHLFGGKTAARIEAPRTDDDGDPVYSESVEDFEANFYTALESGHPCIYVLDSLDSVFSEDEAEVDEGNIKARLAGKKEKGSYGMQKAKKMSSMFRRFRAKVKNTSSLLVVVSQTRENVGAGLFEAKKTRSGGSALEFYSTHVIWLAVEGRNTRGAAKLEVGVDTKAKVSKNKLTGKRRTVSFPIYYDYGVDDISSCIDFMVEFGDWTKAGVSVNPKGMFDGEKFTKASLITAIEDQGKERELSALVGKTWEKVENSVKTDRKKRF